MLTRAITSSAWTGFVMKSTAPASNPRTLSFGSASADRKITAASRVSGIVLEAAARLVAVDARHDDIEQDEQRLRAARNLQRLFAIAGHEKAVARAPERLAQDVQVRGVVIDQEDPAGLFAETGVS